MSTPVSHDPIIVWSNQTLRTPAPSLGRLTRASGSNFDSSLTRSQMDIEETPQMPATDDEFDDEEVARQEGAQGEETSKEVNPTFVDLGISNSVYTISPNQVSCYKTESADSLVSILSRFCETPMGKRHMRFQLMNVFEQKDPLEQRLNFIEFFQENHDLIDMLKPLMRHVLPINKVIKRLDSPGHPYMADWRTILNTLEAIDDLREALASNSSLAYYRDVIDTDFIPQIDQLRIKLGRAFDVDASIQSGDFIVKVGYSEEIDELRSQIQGVEVYIEQAVRSIQDFWKRSQLNPDIQWQIGYFEDVGFLLMVPIETEGIERVASELDEIMHRPISTGPFLYYKNQYFDALDDHYHTPRGKINTISWQIHEEFRVEFLDIAEMISSVIEYIGGLDLLTAFASVAIQYNWKRPLITDNVFTITDGRHPIQSIQTPNFVPNDFIGDKRIKVITGPNASGKSVYISQVALIVHLAMCGSFVPAETACIPMVKNILTVCKPVHTSTNDTSLFMSDLKKLRYALQNCSPSSIVLLDEFGKSTRPEDGTAALTSVIKHFLNLKPSPYVLIVTHFLPLHQLLPKDHFNLQFLEFQAHQDQSEFRYSYSFAEGHAATSLSQTIYKLAGLDKQVAERANEVEQILGRRDLLTATYDGLQEEQLKRVKLVIDKFLRVNHQSFISILKFFSELKAIMKSAADE